MAVSALRNNGRFFLCNSHAVDLRRSTITTPTVKLIPLGGLGGIGKNCLVLECDDTIMVVDVGLMFPEEEMLGVDIVIPDFSYLVANQEKVRGIVLTHGHEDHIGALSYLLEQVNAPVYATPLTRGLVENKLRNSAVKNKAQFHTVQPGQEIVIGPFRVTPFHVNHSIPDAVGLAIRTPLGLIVHTGDFKIDHTPIEGQTTDLGALARLANEGVMLLLSDSTNAESPGYTASESELVDTFQQVFSQAKGRIIVATFASLLSRVQLVIETAAQAGPQGGGGRAQHGGQHRHRRTARLCALSGWHARAPGADQQSAR